MQCPKCGKTGFVNIGSNRFCSNCGAKLAGSTSGGPSTTMADITTMHKTLDLRQQPATPSQNQATGTSSVPSASGAQPAAQLHGQQVSGAGVLDLRAKPEPAAATQPAVVPGSIVTPQPTATAAMPEVVIPPAAPVQTQPAMPEPVATTPQPNTPPAPLSKPTAVEPKPAPAVAPAPLPAAPPVVPAPAPASPPAPVPATPTPEPIPQSPLIQKFPQHPGVAQAAADASAVAATHVDAMSAQAANAPAPPGPPQSPALKQALAAAKQSTAIPNVLKIGAAVVAIGAMAGIVWLQNSPKLAFHTAAAKAGINASLPTYIPSSYHQSGPVTASAGELTLQFSSPNANSIKITQQQTNWDSNSLRDNYVSHQTDSFSAVQGQGLTIYLYGDQADWINHGVWYQITGASHLSRDELLKVAYGL